MSHERGLFIRTSLPTMIERPQLYWGSPVMCIPPDHWFELLRSSVSCVTYPVSNPIGSVGQPEVDMYSPYVPEGQVTGSFISTLKKVLHCEYKHYTGKKGGKNPHIRFRLKISGNLSFLAISFKSQMIELKKK